MLRDGTTYLAMSPLDFNPDKTGSSTHAIHTY